MRERVGAAIVGMVLVALAITVFLSYSVTADPPVRSSDPSAVEPSAPKAVEEAIPAEVPVENPPAVQVVTPPPEEPPEPADNSFCLVCHVNYEEEELTQTHQAVGVGCEKCHGMSDEHSADEDGLTAPEIMYPKAKINPFCTECHPKEEMIKEGNHDDDYGDSDPDEHCTECHGGKHRLEVRTRIWDKNTGKLLSDDGVRMMYEDSPAGSAK